MKKSAFPFIKKFKVDDTHYIYDVNTNEFFKVDEVVYSLIDKNVDEKEIVNVLKKYPSQKIEEVKKNIKQMKQKGYFTSHRPKITFFRGDVFLKRLEEALTHRLEKITLVLTEKCSMRCKYCAYSGHYTYHRNHGTKEMSPEIMRKAVDFYFLHSDKNKEKNISIYGGEPLANFDLLQKCVFYVKNKYFADTRYNMTTNGILLDREKIKFLVENNFSLLISLDGPKDIHDRYRVSRNGKGTYNKIISKLKLFQSMYPEYYSKHLRFNMVLAPPYNFDAINEFISTDETIKKSGGIKFATVSKKLNTFYDQFSSGQREEQITDFFGFVESYNQKLVNGVEPNELEKNILIKRYLNIHRRRNNKLPDTYPSHGQCTLGERGLFINSDGTFNFCSQVEEVFNLGNVNKGYDFTEIIRIFSSLDELYERYCFDCWAIRFCYKCIKEFNRKGVLDEDLFKAVCENNRKSIYKDIDNYIRIREKNYHAFDYLDNIEVA